MAPTPAVQRNAVSEGFALGLVACGRDALPYDKGRLDRAFASAWRSWVHRVEFPQIEADLAAGEDGVSLMTSVETGKQAWALYWEREGGELRVHARQPDWSPGDPDDLNYAATVIDGDVAVAGWEALAREFLAQFEQ